MGVDRCSKVVLSMLFGILPSALVSTLHAKEDLRSQPVEINCENDNSALIEESNCEWLRPALRKLAPISRRSGRPPRARRDDDGLAAPILGGATQPSAVGTSEMDTCFRGAGLGFRRCDSVDQGNWKRQNRYGSTIQGRLGQQLLLAEGDTVKYKRHDKSGGRKGKNSRDKQRYQDRRSRINREWEGQEADAEKRRRNRAKELERKKEFAKKDKQLLTQFQNQREAAWKDKQVVIGNRYRVYDSGNVVKTNLLGKLSAPVASLGTRVFWMGEDNDPGPVAATEIDVNLMRHYLRLGFSTLIGVRILPNRDDLTFLEYISVGISWPSRFSPYLVGRGGVGVMLSERFGDERAYFLGSLGAEVGLDCWVNSWLDIAPALGYARLMVKGAYWNSFTAKIALGF